MPSRKDSRTCESAFCQSQLRRVCFSVMFSDWSPAVGFSPHLLIVKCLLINYTRLKHPQCMAITDTWNYDYASTSVSNTLDIIPVYADTHFQPHPVKNKNQGGNSLILYVQRTQHQKSSKCPALWNFLNKNTHGAIRFVPNLHHLCSCFWRLKHLQIPGPPLQLLRAETAQHQWSGTPQCGKQDVWIFCRDIRPANIHPRNLR